MSDIETLARSIAEQAHAGQVDKLGEPYIDHVARVVDRLDDPLDRAVAWLHDVVEDTDVTMQNLMHHGRDEFGLRTRTLQAWVDVLACVRALTHRPNEPREHYYDRVKAAGPRVVRVKLADIADNSDPARMSRLPEADQVRLTEKYRKAREALTSTS